MSDDTAYSPGPRQNYEADLNKSGFTHDPAQEKAVDALQRIYEELQDNPAQKVRTGLLRRQIKYGWPQVTGLYLWGGVGRGKTYLMDCFFNALPFENKTRLHFHHFMQQVHKARQDYARQRDPLRRIAADWASNRVLCFDEFIVTDIADAMILSRLIQTLFEHNVTLVATSNVDPDELYKEGLKRERFHPAIRSIKANCQIMHLADGADFRLDHSQDSSVYQMPPGRSADAVLAEHFQRLTSAGEDAHHKTIDIQGRTVQTRRQAGRVVWFEFDTLCRTARSANDYIELAQRFDAVMISNVPVLGAQDDSAARRFINAIDEFYDRGVHLFLTARADPEHLYTGHELAFEFERTASRLQEMCSTAYLTSLYQN